MRRIVALLTSALALLAVAAPVGAAPDGSGIVASVIKAPIDPAGDVTGERTDFVVVLDRSLDPAVDGRATERCRLDPCIRAGAGPDQRVNPV